MPSGWIRRIEEKHGEKLRFVAVGIWNTLFGTGALWLLDRYIPYDARSLVQKEAVLILSWVISVTHNFFSFKLLVFHTRGNWLKEYARMYVTYGATFVVQSGLILALSEWLGWSIFWASIPTLAVVTLMSYFGHKYFTFRSKHLIEAIDAGDVFATPASPDSTQAPD